MVIINDNYGRSSLVLLYDSFTTMTDLLPLLQYHGCSLSMTDLLPYMTELLPFNHDLSSHHATLSSTFTITMHFMVSSSFFLTK